MKKHAAEIGQIAMNWNGLHQLLGFTFARLIREDDIDVGMAIWNSIRNDRQARDMLVAAAKAIKGEDNKFYQEIEWAVNQAPRLEDQRDTALHSPYGVQFGQSEGTKTVPASFFGHLRAKKLEGKDLSAEFNNCIDNIAALITFLIGLQRHVNSPEDDPTWPERPPLPRVAHSQPRKAQRQKNSNK